MGARREPERSEVEVVCGEDSAAERGFAGDDQTGG